jgi:hypothetical protein
MPPEAHGVTVLLTFRFVTTSLKTGGAHAGSSKPNNQYRGAKARHLDTVSLIEGTNSFLWA